MESSSIRDEKNTSTRHGSGSSESQISDLEDESHVSLKWNTLVRGERKDLVIVHNRVHGLDPVSIKITVENNPLVVVVWDLSETTHSGGHKSIDPLTSLHVNDTVQLIGLHDLRVQIGNDSLVVVSCVGISKSLPSA